MPGGLNDQFYRLESEDFLLSKVSFEVHPDTTMKLRKKFLYQQATHLEAMLWPNHIYYSPALQADSNLITDHFERTWNVLLLKEAFKLW